MGRKNGGLVKNVLREEFLKAEAEAAALSAASRTCLVCKEPGPTPLILAVDYRGNPYFIHWFCDEHPDGLDEDYDGENED